MPQEAWFWAALLPVVAGYWLAPRAWRATLLALVSFGWVALLSPMGAALVAGAGLVVRVACAAGGRWPLVVGLLLVLQLFAFKLRVADDPSLLVPLGLSYATFKLLHYAVERSRGTLPEPGLATYLAWLFLFPTFSAGPIERLDHLLANTADRLDRGLLVEGLGRVVHGVIKRFVLVELLTEGLDRPSVREVLSSLPDWSPPELAGWLFGSLLIGWLDFSAYSDLAIGASRLFGLRIAENFDWPILARNVGDYWKRNHRTLAAWCQSYVYLPLLGRTRNPIVATYGTFLVMGLWHGCTPSWIGWGLWHATGVAAALGWARARRRWRPRWAEGPLTRPLAHGLTLGWITASQAFVVVSGPTALDDALRLLGRLVGLGA